MHMMASEQISRITSESVDTVMDDPHPILIGCVLQDENFALNLVSLELTGLFFQDEVKVYYALDEMHPYFRERFGVSGTPTYILILSGEILGTLLGRLPPGNLIEHIAKMLANRRAQALHTILQVHKPQREQ